MGKYFGTDGFRGEANVSLRSQHGYQIGRFLGYYYKQDGHRPKVLIGMDTRCSSTMFEAALSSGLTESGADAYQLHVTTTPSVPYLVRRHGFDCGIMISASHNKFSDNGIKLIDGEGHKLAADIELQIEHYIDGDPGVLPRAIKGEIGRVIDYKEGVEEYVQYLTAIPGCRFDGMRVGLDCANGSSSALAKRVFEALGAETVAVCCEPDGININAGCGSTHLENLCSLVKEQHLDMGFAFDGDADRCLAADEQGNEISGDGILYLCGSYLKDKGRLDGNTVVTTVMSNMGLYKAFDKLGIGYAKTDVGDKYVSKCMTENGYVLGGEQSGHIIFGQYATTGDGILTALLVMETIIARGKKPSELVAPFRIYPQLLVNVEVKDKDAVMNCDAVKAIGHHVEKELGDRGRLLLRKSGTEPLIRVMVEAETPELCKEYVDKVAEVVRRC